MSSERGKRDSTLSFQILSCNILIGIFFKYFSVLVCDFAIK